MNEPQGVNPTAVYTPKQACEALGIGESKLQELVKAGQLHPLAYSHRWRFFGQRLIEFCLRESAS